MARQSTKEVEQEFVSEREAILARPKVKLTIPPDRLDKAKHREVIINGQTFILAVGKEIEVPDVVAQVWNESYNKTVQAELAMDAFNEIQ